MAKRKRKRVESPPISKAVQDMQEANRAWSGNVKGSGSVGIPVNTVQSAQDKKDLRNDLCPAPGQRVWINKHSYIRDGTILKHIRLAQPTIVMVNGLPITRNLGGQGCGFLRNQLVTVPGRITARARNPNSFPLSGCDRPIPERSPNKVLEIREALPRPHEICSPPTGRAKKRTQKRKPGRLYPTPGHHINKQEQTMRNAHIADKYRTA